MANVYQQQTQQPMFPLNGRATADLGQTSDGLARAFGPFLKYAWPIIIVIVIGIAVAAVIQTKSAGGKGKDKEGDEKK